jgi:heptaprenyl diphosphate synthase
MNERTLKMARLAMMLALATSIHALEALTPVTLGWFRFGFANIIGLATLIIFGFRDAFYVTVGRIFVGGLLSGSLGTPSFFLALSGGVVSIVFMGAANLIKRRYLSEIGISVIGAVAHNMAQLFAAYLLIVRNDTILTLAPIMILTATATGFINGMATHYLVLSLRKQWRLGQEPGHTSSRS